MGWVVDMPETRDLKDDGLTVTSGLAVSVSSSEDCAWAFLHAVSAALEAGQRFPALGEGIPMSEIRRVMMRIFPAIGDDVSLVRNVTEMNSLLPVAATIDRPLLQEVLYATLLRSVAGKEHWLSWADYDTLTLAWRCTIGPLHPEDDNDVCRDAYVEWQARNLQRDSPGITRPAARAQAFLMKPSERDARFVR